MVLRTICISSVIILGVNSQILTQEERDDFINIINGNARSKLNFRSVREEEVGFYLYNNYAANGTLLTPDNLDDVDVSLPFVFIIHGWTSAANDTFVLELADAFLSKGDYNVIAVDWSTHADRLYTESAEYTRDVGHLLGNLIHTISENYRATLENVEVIGHSLGAHVAGFAGKRVQNLTGMILPRITGLDPAGPLFEGFWVSEAERLHEDDAEVVVALHTDAGAAGYSSSIGTIDFFPNGGEQQPGCIFKVDFTISCSHTRSTDLYAEAVTDSEAFLSRRCSSYLFYLLGLCDENDSLTLGGNLTAEDAGSYYLQTGSESPFSLN